MKRLICYLVMVAILLGVTGCGKAQKVVPSPVIGEWKMELDMTDNFLRIAQQWLGDDMGEVEGNLPLVEVIFTANADGSWKQEVSTDSYYACHDEIYRLMEEFICDAVIKKLKASGYEGEADRDFANSLVFDTTGMMVAEYLDALTLELIPELEDLEAKYNGKGFYETSGNEIARTFSEEEPQGVFEFETFLVGDGTLVFVGGEGEGYPLMYKQVMTAEDESSIDSAKNE